MSMTDSTAPAETSGNARASRPLEIAFAATALAVSVVYLYLGTQIHLRREALPGQIDARFWPLLLGTVAVAAALILLVMAIARPAPSRDDIEIIRPGGVLRVILTVLATLAYVAVWSLSSVVAFGYRLELFPVVTAIYLIGLMFLYGQRRWVGLIVYPVLLTAFIYLLFGMLLRIPL